MPLSKLPLHCMIISFLFSLLVTFWRNFFKKPHLFSTSNFFRLLHRTLLKVSWKTSSHHSTSLNQYLNLWVSLENYLISPFYTQNTSLRHSTLCCHTEWWWYQNCCWEESGSDSFGWIERCPSGGMFLFQTFKKGVFCRVGPPPQPLVWGPIMNFLLKKKTSHHYPILCLRTRGNSLTWKKGVQTHSYASRRGHHAIMSLRK